MSARVFQLRGTSLPFSGMRSAVDVQHLTGHEGILSEVQHSIDDLQALPNPLDRMQWFEKLIRLRLTEPLLKTN